MEVDYTEVFKEIEEINSYTYKIGISSAFVITDPKVREVFAADFRDRIVHHLVINELEPYFEQYFIAETFSCLKGRGTLHGVEKLASVIEEKSEHYSKIIADRFPIQKKETNAEKQVDKKNIAAQLYLVGSTTRLKYAISYLLESLVKADKGNEIVYKMTVLIEKQC